MGRVGTLLFFIYTSHHYLNFFFKKRAYVTLKFFKCQQSYLVNGSMGHLNFTLYHFLYIKKYTLKISVHSKHKTQHEILFHALDIWTKNYFRD